MSLIVTEMPSDGATAVFWLRAMATRDCAADRRDRGLVGGLDADGGGGGGDVAVVGGQHAGVDDAGLGDVADLVDAERPGEAEGDGEPRVRAGDAGGGADAEGEDGGVHLGDDVDGAAGGDGGVVDLGGDRVGVVGAAVEEVDGERGADGDGGRGALAGDGEGEGDRAGDGDDRRVVGGPDLDGTRRVDRARPHDRARVGVDAVHRAGAGAGRGDAAALLGGDGHAEGAGDGEGLDAADRGGLDDQPAGGVVGPDQRRVLDEGLGVGDDRVDGDGHAERDAPSPCPCRPRRWPATARRRWRRCRSRRWPAPGRRCRLPSAAATKSTSLSSTRARVWPVIELTETEPASENANEPLPSSLVPPPATAPPPPAASVHTSPAVSAVTEKRCSAVSTTISSKSTSRSVIVGVADPGVGGGVDAVVAEGAGEGDGVAAGVVLGEGQPAGGGDDVDVVAAFTSTASARTA